MAAAKDPFDLRARAGGAGQARPHAAREWTAEEQAEKLKDYLEVAPEHWEHIRYGAHVRYVTNEGLFRPGGFVKRNPLDMQPRGGPDEKRFMSLQNNYNDKAAGYATWLVAYEDIEKIYVKPDAGTLTVFTDLKAAVHGLNENIRRLAEFAKKLSERVDALERRQ